MLRTILSVASLVSWVGLDAQLKLFVGGLNHHKFLGCAKIQKYPKQP